MFSCMARKTLLNEEGKWFSCYWKDDDLEESVDDWDVGDI